MTMPRQPHVIDTDHAEPEPADAHAITSPDSIHAPRVAQWKERRQVEQETGLRLREDGTIILPQRTSRRR